eukprot:3723040-Rhodomonas_salina.2
MGAQQLRQLNVCSGPPYFLARSFALSHSNSSLVLSSARTGRHCLYLNSVPDPCGLPAASLSALCASNPKLAVLIERRPRVIPREIFAHQKLGQDVENRGDEAANDTEPDAAGQA